ncbi:class I SAM-dependent methyltransferase [Bacillus salitolerans]|uniref:Class I SAM-dependent methyltransferase n=1 Tax=Bacillus salitolerans TaxID=1437434 RepID=A0ABW4LLA7_9BACI
MGYTYTDLLAMFGIGGAHPGGLSLTRAILAEINMEDCHNLLEVGCGTGQTTSYICHHYPCSVYAIDSHPIMITKTNERLSSLNKTAIVKEASTENLPFASGFFDLILSESVTVFTNIQKSLEEYSRVLMEKGTLILIEMTEIDTLLESEKTELKDYYGIDQILQEQEWKDLILTSGFKTVEAISVRLEELEIDDLDFTEFNISESIDQAFYQMLDKHHELTSKYTTKLGFRVFLCNK